MKDLTITNFNGQLVIDSREVAEMIGKDHDQLLRSIRRYVEVLNSSHSAILQTANFFIPSTYADAQKQERPCYLITKKGCDMVANKMTGEKGVLFTATYVTKFEEMKNRIASARITSAYSPSRYNSPETVINNWRPVTLSGCTYMKLRYEAEQQSKSIHAIAEKYLHIGMDLVELSTALEDIKKLAASLEMQSAQITGHKDPAALVAPAEPLLPAKTDWKSGVSQRITAIVAVTGMAEMSARGILYKTLEKKTGCT